MSVPAQNIKSVSLFVYLFETGPGYTAQAELMILLPLPSEG
jgi:hypothetical protein